MSQMHGSLAEQFKQATGRTGRWPHVVKVFDLHHNAHIEEFLALIDALRDNEKHISGSRSAAVEFSNAGMFTPDGRPVEVLEAEGRLPIGNWGGYFDEHRLSRALQEERVSAAMIMSDFTGSYQDEAWRPLVNYVSDNDSKGRAKPWDLASLVLKMHAFLEFQGRLMYRKTGVEVTEAQRFQRVFQFVSLVVDARYAKNRGDLKTTPETTGFWANPAEYVGIWLIIRFGKRCSLSSYQQDKLISELWTPDRQPHNRPLQLADGSKTSNVAEYVAERLGLKDKALNLIGTVLALAKRNNAAGAAGPWDLVTILADVERYLRYKGGKFAQRDCRAEYLGEMATLALDAAYHNQSEFMDAVDTIEAARQRNASDQPVSTGDKYLPGIRYRAVRGKDHIRRCLAVMTRTNNPMAHKALCKFDPKPAVTVHRRSNGQVTIFGFKYLDMTRLYAQLLEAETQYGREDVLPARIWMHFQRNDANNIMNGGRSAPGVPPTRIPLSIIVKLVVEAMQTINHPRKTKSLKVADIIAELGQIVSASVSAV